MKGGMERASKQLGEILGKPTGTPNIERAYKQLEEIFGKEDSSDVPKIELDPLMRTPIRSRSIANEPSERELVLKGISDQEAKIDSIISVNKSAWDKEMAGRSKPFYFDPGISISIPDLHPEQKKLEAAKVELRAAEKTARAYNETDYANDEKQGKEKWFYERFLDGLKSSTQDDVADMLTAGFYGLADKKRTYDALSRSSKGENVTEADQTIVDAFKLNTDAEQYRADNGGSTAWTSIGEGMPATVGFTLGMALSGGSLGLTGSVVKGTVLKEASKVAMREAARTTITSGTLNNLSDRAESQFRVDENGNAEKYNEQNPYAMLAKSYISSYTENISEQVGRFVPKGIMGNGMKYIAPKVLGARLSDYLDEGVGVLATKTEGARELIQKTTNWNGTLNEFLEEEFNNVVEPIVTGEFERLGDNFTLKNQFITAGSVAAFGAVMHSAALPSVASDYARRDAMRRKVSKTINSIQDETFRTGVFNAIKRGTTIEDKATKLADLDWSNVSKADRANAVDALTWNTNLEIYKGVQQQKDVEQGVAQGINNYNTWFKHNVNEDSGKVEEIEDENGERYTLKSGNIRNPGIDEVVFAIKETTGEAVQLNTSSIKPLSLAYDYNAGLKAMLEGFGVVSTQQMAEAESAELEADAQASGVRPDFYEQGQKVELSNGKVAYFKQYLKDGSNLVEVIEIDPESLDENTIRIQRSQIAGRYVEPEQGVQSSQAPSTAEPNGTAAQNAPVPESQPEAPQPEVEAPQPIPLQEDGTPDYDAMSPQMFYDEYSKSYSQEDALQMLDDELIDNREAIRKLEKKSQGASRNEKIKQRSTIEALRQKESEISTFLESQRSTPTPEAAPTQSFEVGENIRQKYQQAPKAYGIEKKIIAPNDEAIPGRYVLVESGTVTPSHDPRTFARSQGFPTTESGSTVNDRDYSKDRDAQGQVVTIAQKYNGRAIDNPVVVTPDGVVISGNNRTMSGELAAANGTDGAYLQHLADSAPQYGFTSEQVEQFQNPRIVFETSNPLPYTTETFAKFNAQETKTQNKVERAVKIGKTIDSRVIRQVSGIIDEHENLGDLYADTNSVNRIVKTLVNNGVISQNEVASLMDGDNLSGTGKDTIETLLVGSVLSEDAVRLVNRDGMKQYRNKITRSILPILDNSTLGDYSIVTDLSQAARILDQARQQKSTVSDLLLSQDMFESTDYSPVAISMAKALEGSDKGIKQLFTNYNNRASSSANGQLDMITGTVLSKEQVLQDMGMAESQDQKAKDAEQVDAKVQANEQATPEQDVNDPIAMAQTPLQKYRSVAEVVNNLNRISGVQALVFTDVNELPSDLIPYLDSEFETDGLTFKGVSYVFAPLMHDTPTTQRTYIHEVAGHANIERAINKSEHKMFFEAVVDDIGLDAMLDLQINELSEEVARYQQGLISKKQLGREYIAYQTENYFTLDDFNKKSEDLFIDLSTPITDEIIGQILKSTNNGTGKIGIIPRRAKRLRVVSSADGVLQNRTRDRSGIGTANTSQSTPSDGSRMGDAEINTDGADQQGGIQNSMGSDTRTLSEQDQGGTHRDQQAVSSEVDSGVHNPEYNQINQDDNVRNLSGRSQRDSSVDTNEISPNEGTLLDEDRGRGGRMGDEVPQGGGVPDGQLQRSQGASVLPPTISGERSDNRVPEQDGTQLGAEGTYAGDINTSGDDTLSTEGDNVDNRTGDEASDRADDQHGESFAQRTARAKIEQKRAEKIPVSVADIDNIRNTLPLLLSEQQDDVLKAEVRFFSDKHKTKALSYGKGMLFTNGTGTGKTYTGFGIIKRFHKQGKNNMLIVVPAEAKIDDWTKESKSFNLNVHTLESTKDKGKGLSITTFANFRANESIKERDFDLIIYDECHRLMESNQGVYSSTSRAHFQMCNRSVDDAIARIEGVHPLWKEEQRALDGIKKLRESKGNASSEALLQKTIEGIRERQKAVMPEIEQRAQKAFENTKVLYLSATPFKSYFNLRYANGTLFDWNDTEHVSYGRRVDPESTFMLDNFGAAFEWKNNRLQQKSSSNAEAIAMQEIEFADKLMESGVMSSRAIESNMDYSREFPLVTLGRADVFNKGYNDLFSYGVDAKFGSLSEFARKIFYDYNYSTQLYESLRASMSIDRIRQHIELGRKVVVFHRRKQANVSPPFKAVLNLARKEADKILEGRFISNYERARAEKIKTECDLFESTNFELLNYELSLDYSSALDQITKAFGSKKVVTMNGDTPKSQKSKNIDLFNSDTSGVDIIVIQEEAGKEGISLHDKTGKHQRVLMNMSLPISSTTALQVEGRIYRIGQESDAIFEYPLLGLDMEIANFGQTINRKLSTTENLATGSQARDLIRSFAEGVLSNSTSDAPNLNQGRGGKEFDKRNTVDTTPFNRAVLMYETNQRNRQRRGEREGTDFYATPEPIGYKMVEMLNLRSGESVLEPSAGDGRIAMWFPSSSNSTIVEPSYTLFSKASARAGGGNRKFIQDQFETFNIVNKFDGIAMNPPFGSGGSLAMSHLEKAFGHLRENGRIVAIIPRGAMDRKLDDFLYGENTQGKLINPDAHLVASIDLPNVTFEQSGTKVGTRIVVIDKTKAESPTVNIDLSGVNDIKDLFSKVENISIPSRGGSGVVGNIKMANKTMDAEHNESTFESFIQKHSTTGADLYMASPNRHLGSKFKSIVSLAKEYGGYYSSYSNNSDNIRSGFVFSNQEAADSFTNEADAILADNDIRLREVENSTSELSQIKEAAIERGDFMKAPNGKPTNLSEKQWLEVRTKAFKEWFGDWEKSARIEKLRSSTPVEITGKEIEPSEDLKECRRNALIYGKTLKGEYVNQDTGIKILVSNTGLEKLMSHDKQSIQHIQSIAAIPQLIESSVFITELQPGKENHKFDSYKYFVSGLKINGENYTIKIVVGEKNGARYYDHSLSEIEKGELLSKIDALSIAFNAGNSPNSAKDVTLSDLKDKRLVSILQTNYSNDLDSNGEPIIESLHSLNGILLKEAHLQREYEQNKDIYYVNPTKRKSLAKEQLQKLSKEFGVETMIVDSVRDLPDNIRYATKNKRFSGLYHKQSGKVYFISGQIKDADDATATFMHEVVSHKGIDGLMGRERADEFYTAVFKSLKPYDQEAMLRKHGSPRIAGDELVASMAEGDVTPGMMQRIIAAVRKFFRETLGIPLTIKDNDIRYILWKSKNNLQRASTLSEVMHTVQRDNELQRSLYPKTDTLFDKIALKSEQRRRGDAIRFNEANALGLKDKSTTVVIAKDGFTNFAKAKDWAVENLVGRSFVNKDTGESIYVNREAVNKITSGKAIGKSASEGVHLKAIKALQPIIENSILSEVHADKKSNPNVIEVQRFYGAIEIDNEIYRVKSTVRRLKPEVGGSKFYSYEVQEIELLKERQTLLDRNPITGNPTSSNSSTISMAKLLKGVRKTNGSEYFAENNSDIRYRETKSQKTKREEAEQEYRVAGKKGSLKSMGVQVQEALQDATIKVKMLQDEVVKRGGIITPDTNVYESLNHSDSIAKANMDSYEKHHMEPIVNFITSLKDKGVTYEMFTKYMLAKHSIERHDSGINALSEDGAWTREVAQNEISEVEGKLSEAKISKFWNMWNKATLKVLDTAVASGRMSLATKNKILGRNWQYYVPLRGKDFDFENEVDYNDLFYYNNSSPRGGSKVDSKNADIKARGRRSKAADPISTLQHMANVEFYTSSVNDTRRVLLKLVQQNPQMVDLFGMKERWFIKVGESWNEVYDRPDKKEILRSNTARRAIAEYEKRIAKETNKDKISELQDAIIAEQSNVTVTKHSIEAPGWKGIPEGKGDVAVMKDGMRYVVVLKEHEVAQVFTYKSGGLQNWSSKWPGRLTRGMSQLLTSKNPAFLAPNLVRDIQQGAMYNFIDSDGDVNGYLKHAATSWGVLGRNLMGNGHPLTVAEMGGLSVLDKKERAQLVAMYNQQRVDDTLYELFVMNGGETGYVHIMDPAAYQKKLEKEIATKTGKNYAKKGWKAFNNGIDYLANMSENIVRYATFMSQIDRGASVFDAVSYAKNITVNFNTKGKYSKGLGVLYMFFNAGVQGVRNSYSLWGNKYGKSPEVIRAQRARFVAAHAALAAAGYVSATLMYNVLSGLIGDDGEEFVVSDYERRTNLIIPVPGVENGYFKIPIPIVMRPSYALGVMTCDWVNGKIEADDVMSSFMDVLIDSSSPIPVDYSIQTLDAKSIAKPFIPSIFEPSFDIVWYNQNFMGMPINRETYYSPNTPDSQLGQRNANEIAVSVSKFLNRLGGGNDVTPAGMNADGKKDIRQWLDISPSTLEYIAVQYSGGIGRIINEISHLLTDTDKQARHIPIGNKFYGTAYERDPSQEYYSIKKGVEFNDKNIRDTDKLGIRNTLFSEEELPAKRKEVAKDISTLNLTEKRITTIKKRMKETLFGSDEYNALETEIDKLQRKFIKEYNDDKRD